MQHFLLLSSSSSSSKCKNKKAPEMKVKCHSGLTGKHGKSSETQCNMQRNGADLLTCNVTFLHALLSFVPATLSCLLK